MSNYDIPPDFWEPDEETEAYREMLLSNEIDREIDEEIEKRTEH